MTVYDVGDLAFTQQGEVAEAIMPVWRVSETLPAELGSFDLVIVDEASQSDITALPALLRGKKILVVGDNKQVSPTAPFIEEGKLLHLRDQHLLAGETVKRFS